MAGMFVNWLTRENKVKVIGRSLEPNELLDFEKECTAEFGPGDIEIFGTAKLARLYADRRK